jgi:hypothetical protein
VAEVRNAWFESAPGQVAVTIAQGETLEIRMDVAFHADVEDPIFAITLQNEAGHPAFVSSSDAKGIVTGRFEAGTNAAIRIRFDNWLAPGRYLLIATVARAGFGADRFDAHMSNSIIVLADRRTGGMVDLPHTFEIDTGVGS